MSRSTALTEDAPRPPVTPLRVAVVGDCRLVCEGLAALLREDGLDARSGAPSAPARPDVAVLCPSALEDVDELVAEVREDAPGLRLVLVLGHPAGAELTRAAHLGIEGLVDAYGVGRGVGHIVRTVARGGHVSPARVARDTRGDALAALSERQRDVLALLVTGRSNGEIAEELVISINTVKFHVRTIFSELGIRNRVEATRRWTAQADGDRLLA